MYIFFQIHKGKTNVFWNGTEIISCAKETIQIAKHKKNAGKYQRNFILTHTWMNSKISNVRKLIHGIFFVVKELISLSISKIIAFSTSKT